MLHSRQIDKLYDLLGSRIRNEREKANFKQTYFANLLKMSRGSLVNIEKGRQKAPLHVIYEIARILSIEVDTLLPHKDEVVRSEVSNSIKGKILENSQGNEELQRKLTEFVKSH